MRNNSVLFSLSIGLIFIVNTSLHAQSVLSGTVTATNALCSGGTGTVSVQACGGTGSYTFTISSGNFCGGDRLFSPTATDRNEKINTVFSVKSPSGQTCNVPYVFSGIPVGTYHFTVDDGVTVQTVVCVFSISAPPLLTLQLLSTSPACAGQNNGSICVNASGGTPPYTFSKNGGTTFVGVSQTGQNYCYNYVGGGTYTLVVQDANGCTASIGGVTVDQFPPVTGTVSATSACQTGTATITAQLDQIPGRIAQDVRTNRTSFACQTFVISGGIYGNGTPFQSPLSGVVPGTYTISYQDCESPCVSIIGTVTVSSCCAQDATVQAYEVTCKGASNGMIYLTGLNGGSPPYKASIDGIHYVDVDGSPLTPAFSGLAPSTFNVFLRDATGCTKVIALITITEPTLLTQIVTQSGPISCITGTVTLTTNAAGGTPGMTIQGGTGSYTYRIDGGAQQFNNVFITGPGNHSITVSDAAGCITTTMVVVPGSFPMTFAYKTAVNNTCFNGMTGQLGLSATGGTGTVTYTLTKPRGTQVMITGAQGGVVTFTGLPAGVFTVTATATGSGCVTTTTMTITQPSPVMPPGTTNGAPDLLLNVVLSGSSFPTSASCITATYTASIKTGGGANIAAQGVIVRITKLSDVYTITLDPSSSAMWTEITDGSFFKEFQLNNGFDLSCGGVGIPLVIRECRNGDSSKSAGAVVVASVRMQSGPQDTNSFDNVRASVFQLQ